jgi:type IV pilus assembly protein PilQ
VYALIRSLCRAPRVSLAIALLAACGIGFPLRAHAAAATAPKTVTLDAEDASLPSVLKILAEKGDLNIVTGPGVANGKLSIHMKDVPIDQAVNLVVRAAGLAYERIGNSVLVADARSLKEETGITAYIVQLRYADANEVQAAIKSLTTDVQVDRGGNRLIVMTSPRVIAQVQEMVATLDQPSRQVLLEARIVEVSTDDAKTLGIDWDKLMHQNFVFIEGDSGSSLRGVLPATAPFIPAAPGKKFPNSFGPFARQAMGFNVAVDLLISNGNAKVLANPKLVTLNGHEADMLVGERIPYTVSSTVFAGSAAAPTLTVEKEEVGVKLRITPVINVDGYITTDISPEVSVVTGFTGVNNDLPIVSTRQAHTTVRLKDGNTVIIGGLLNEESTKGVSKVPLLGDIPFFGYLFQHQTSEVRKIDLVIEVTPHIVQEP